MQNLDSLADKILGRQKKTTGSRRCFAGFDGFTDEIISAVEKREGPDEFTAVESMEDFGNRIVDAAGKSCNIELIVKRVKLGGNAPIFTEAFLHGGHLVTLAGTIGTTEEIERVFEDLASRCDRVIALGQSGHTDAIEFKNGKVLLGKLEPLHEVKYDALLSSIGGKEALIEALDETDLFVSVNWTMLPYMTELWEKLVDEVVPELSENKRSMFIDLCDPAKRNEKDLTEALRILKKFRKRFRVILGLNQAEAELLADLFACGSSPKEIQKKSGLDIIVVHAAKWAAAYDGESEVKVEAPHTENPVLLTGAGDNFNAGFCNGQLFDLDLEESLASGVYTAGFYVRNGKSPTIQELADFMKQYKKKETS